MSNKKSRVGAIFAIVTIVALFGTLTTATAAANIGTVTINARRGAPEPPAIPGQNACKIDDSVALHTGEFIWSMTDLVLPGRGPDLVIAHTYKSGSNIRGRWGRGWHLSVDVRVLKLENGNLLLVDGDGQKLEFRKPEDGSVYAPPPGVSDTLIENENGTFTRAKQAGDRYEFDKDGKLIQIEDRNGNGWRLDYATPTDENMSVTGTSDFFMTVESGILAWTHQLKTISDISGLDSRKIQFEYYSDGRLRRISGPGDYEMAYEYDSSGRLTHIILPALSGAASDDADAYRFIYEGDASRMTQVTDPEGLAIIRNAYDASGRIAEQTHHGRTVMFSYAEEGNMTTVTRANGAVDEYVFNDWGNPVRIVLDKGDETLNLETRYAYDDRMNLTRITDPEGTQTTYSYDSDGKLDEIIQDSAEGGRRIETRSEYEDGRLTSVIGARGYRTRFEYDESENLSRIEYATGKEIRFTYGDYGYLIKAKTTGNNQTAKETSFSYNANGFIKEITDSDGKKAAVTYDAMGNVETFEDRNGLTLFYAHDSRNRLIEQGVRASDGDKAVTRFHYMSNGQLREVMPPEGPATAYSYDDHGRLTGIGGAVFAYGDDGNIASVADAQGRESRFFYDAVNRLVRRESVVEGQANPVTQYRYDQNNNLAEFIDAEDRSTWFAYDALDRLTEITYPDLDAATRAYDDAGNLSRMEDLKTPPSVFNYTYNKLDQLTELTFNNGKVSYSYNGLMDQLSKSVLTYNGNTHAIAYNYTSLGQIEWVQQGDYLVQYGYDPGGRQSQLIYPDEQYIQYHYDDLGRLSSITEANGDDIAVFEHDEAGRPTKKSLANGLYQQYSRESDAHRVEKIENYRATDALPFSTIQYEDDGMGNPETVTRATGDSTQEYEYSFDAFYRLTRADYSANTGLADAIFTYDAAGNRKTESREGANISYTVNDLNQYTKVDGKTYENDANGNLKSDPENQYDYDPLNRLIEVDADGTTVAYAYDQNGRLISRRLIGSGTTTAYVYDAGRLIAEYNDQGPIRKYVRHPVDGAPLRMTVIDGDVNYYYLTDRNGSVVAITDEAGEIVERYAYDAFGNFVIRDVDGEIIETSSVGNPFYFAGKRFDGTTGLYIEGCRHYHPGLGRYLQPNPDGYDMAGNSYTYMNNNPFNGHILPLPQSAPLPESANPAEAIIRDLFSDPYVTVDPALPRPTPALRRADPNTPNAWTPPETGTTIPFLIQMPPMTGR